MKEEQIGLEAEICQILIKLRMNPTYSSNYMCLKDAILIAIDHPNTWQDTYLETIGKQRNVTRERIRQILYKAACDNWNKESKNVLAVHFGRDVQTHFQYAKPNHIEFIEMMANLIRENNSL